MSIIHVQVQDNTRFRARIMKAHVDITGERVGRDDPVPVRSESLRDATTPPCLPYWWPRRPLLLRAGGALALGRGARRLSGREGAAATGGRRGRRGERQRRQVRWWKGPESGRALARAGADPVGEGPARGPATARGGLDSDSAGATLAAPELECSGRSGGWEGAEAWKGLRQWLIGQPFG